MDAEGTEYTLPTWTLPILINGDETGATEEEIQKLNDFLEREGLSNGHWAYDFDSEYYFSRRNDLDNLGGDVVDIVWIHHPEQV